MEHLRELETRALSLKDVDEQQVLKDAVLLKWVSKTFLWGSFDIAIRVRCRNLVTSYLLHIEKIDGDRECLVHAKAVLLYTNAAINSTLSATKYRECFEVLRNLAEKASEQTRFLFSKYAVKSLVCQFTGKEEMLRRLFEDYELNEMFVEAEKIHKVLLDEYNYTRLQVNMDFFKYG